MTTPSERFAAEFRSLTDVYLRQVRNCTRRLPDAVRAYGTDREQFRHEVERLSAVESECDSTLRQVRALVGESMPPNFTVAYLHAGDVVDLYAEVDAVANRAEQFGRELAAIEPAVTDPELASLVEMAEMTDEATGVLTNAVLDRADDLSTVGEVPPIEDAVEAIDALESECDAAKYELIETGFTDGTTVEALAVRELALVLDGAMDAVEDAADHLVYMASRDP
ncbi:hypothetical protein BRC83_03525 [Halobacteriales archaeon QS_1_68_17]|nr:MAG: hypothetical protein BRC83_03525 [Halobacteriales archaeon QS_1_68_17]